MKKLKTGGSQAYQTHSDAQRKINLRAFIQFGPYCSPTFTYTLQPLAFAADTQPPFGKQIILINKIKN